MRKNILKTRVLRVDSTGDDAIAEAAGLIAAGEVVAFPTETVYGLGGNALDDRAVEKIFAAKGRPADNPLIVHIAEYKQLDLLVRRVPDGAAKAMAKFWPGPLTVVLPSSDAVASGVTAGLGTVAVRMPGHPVALDIIRTSGLPVAAPSANLSGRPSPTAASHVLEDMDGRIPLIIDGGRTNIGLESTVLDMTGEIPVILRPGGVTVEMLRRVLGQVRLDKNVLSQMGADEPAASPGMKHTHYAPRARVIVVRGSVDGMVREIGRLAEEYATQGMKVGIMATCETRKRYGGSGVVSVLGSRRKPAVMAANLFSALREFDALGVDVVLAEAVGIEEEGLAIMNRMVRAAGFCIVDI